MRLKQQFLTRNDCFRAGKTIRVRGVMVHSTGANNPRVSRYVPGDAETGFNTAGNHWDRPGIQKCVHAFVGRFADGGVGTVQTLPWNRRAWHAGGGQKGSANDTHAAFEICEDGLDDPAWFQAVYWEAAELTAMLCREYGLDPLEDGVVICHAEGHKRGIASNHGDVLHWFRRHGRTMDDFRADTARILRGEEDQMLNYEQFKEYMERYEKERAALPAPDWAGKTGEWNLAKDRGIIADLSRPQSPASRVEVAAMIIRAGK